MPSGLHIACGKKGPARPPNEDVRERPGRAEFALCEDEVDAGLEAADW